MKKHFIIIPTVIAMFMAVCASSAFCDQPYKSKQFPSDNILAYNYNVLDKQFRPRGLFFCNTYGKHKLDQDRYVVYYRWKDKYESKECVMSTEPIMLIHLDTDYWLLKIGNIITSEYTFVVVTKK